MNNGTKKFLLPLAFLFIVSGFFFCIEPYPSKLVHLVNHLLNLTLDEHFRAIGFSYLGTWLIITGIICLLYLIRLGNKITARQFFGMSSGLVVLHYFFHLFSNAVNYPLYDDQGAILHFILKYQDAGSITDKLSVIMTPYNESMIIFPKLFVLAWLKVFGVINFSHLLLFNGFLLVITHLLIFMKSRINFWPLLFVQTLFIFQFQFYDDAFWAISGLCYYGTFIFAALTFYFLPRKTFVSNFTSISSALIAALTFGNGWILFPVCCFILYKEKRIVAATVWTLIFLILVIVSFSLRSAFHPLASANLNPVDNSLFILIFLGSAFQFFYSSLLAFVAGLFIATVFVMQLFKKKASDNSFSSLMLAFLIFSAIAASPLRSALEANGHYGLHIRYGVFSILAFCLCISLLTTDKNIQKKFWVILAGAAFIYNALTGLFFYPEVVIRKEKEEVAVQEMKQNNFDIKYTTYSKDEINAMMREAIARGIYQP
jgi:hypothetical protein